MAVHVQRERPSRRPTELDLFACQILLQRHRCNGVVIRRRIQSGLQRAVVVDVVVRDDRFHAAGALAVFKGVRVLFDRYILQITSAAAVLYGVLIIYVIEGMTRHQQGHRRNRPFGFVVVVPKRIERAAADGDGPAVVIELYASERTTRNVQCAVVNPLTLVH